MAYKEKKEYDKALEDLNKAIKLKPDDNMYYYRANIYYTIDQFDQALKDYSKAISIDPTKAHYFQMQGLVYYLKQENNNAFNSFMEAIKLEEKPSYTYFFLMMSAFKISEKKYREVKQLLKEKVHLFEKSDWYKMIAQFLIEELNMDTLLSNANKDNEKLCEVYFYIGYNYLINNKKDKAKDYFKKCINTNIDYYLEYKLAKFELEKL